MATTLTIVLQGWETVELMRILAEGDAAAALAFLKRHFRGQGAGLVESG